MSDTPAQYPDFVTLLNQAMLSYFRSHTTADADAEQSEGKLSLNGPWLAANLKDADGQPFLSRQTTSNWLAGKKVGRVEILSAVALQRLFGIHQSVWLMASAISEGIEPPPGGSFIHLIPTFTDKFPISTQMHFRDLMVDVGQALQLTD